MFPFGFHKKVADAGLYGVRFPKKYGGLDMGWTAETGAFSGLCFTSKTNFSSPPR